MEASVKPSHHLWCQKPEKGTKGVSHAWEEQQNQFHYTIISLAKSSRKRVRKILNFEAVAYGVLLAFVQPVHSSRWCDIFQLAVAAVIPLQSPCNFCAGDTSITSAERIPVYSSCPPVNISCRHWRVGQRMPLHRIRGFVAAVFFRSFLQPRSKA